MKNILLAVAGVGLVLAAACGTSETTTLPPGTSPSVVTRSPAPTPGTLSPAPTPPSAPRPIGQVLIPVEDVAPRAEKTQWSIYLLEVATDRLWEVPGAGYAGLDISPDGTAVLLSDAGYLDVVDLSDGSAVRIVDSYASNRDSPPIWSPDSKQIAFVSGGLYLVNKDGSGLRQVYSRGVWSPKWSPLGGQIAFVGDTSTLNILNLSSGTTTVIAAEASAFSPTGLCCGSPPSWPWSPDGSLLAFEDKDGLVIYDASTGEQRLLVNGPVDNPSWSPDSSRIMYGVDVPSKDLTNAYYVVDVNAPGQARLVVPAAYMDRAFWSSDGRIGYVSSGCWSGGEFDIYITDTAGTSHKRLTTTPEQHTVFAAWQPGGSAIVTSNYEGVVIIDADSGAVRTVVLRDGEAPGSWASWSPDGRYLILRPAPNKGVCN